MMDDKCKQNIASLINTCSQVDATLKTGISLKFIVCNTHRERFLHFDALSKEHCKLVNHACGAPSGSSLHMQKNICIRTGYYTSVITMLYARKDLWISYKPPLLLRILTSTHFVNGKCIQKYF